MGMFDVVNVACPRCNYYVQFQSKAGECTGNTYHKDSVPVKIAEDITGSTKFCSKCGTFVEVKKQSKVVSMAASTTS